MASKACRKHVEDVLKMSFFQTSASFTAHLVTATPPDDFTTLSNCTLASGGNYTSVNLSDVGGSSSNRIINLGGGVSKMQLASAFWPNLTTNGTPIVGCVVSQFGSSESTQCVAYIERKVGGVPTPFTPDGSPFVFNLSVQGVWRMARVEFAFNWLAHELMRQQQYWNSNTIRYHLVTAAPPATAETLDDCALATGSGYASVVGVDLNNNSANRVQRVGNVIRYVQQNPEWVGASTDAPIVGLVASEGVSSWSKVLSYVPRAEGPIQLNGDPFSLGIETAGFLVITI